MRALTRTDATLGKVFFFGIQGMEKRLHVDQATPLRSHKTHPISRFTSAGLVVRCRIVTRGCLRVGCVARAREMSGCEVSALPRRGDGGHGGYLASTVDPVDAISWAPAASSAISMASSAKTSLSSAATKPSASPAAVANDASATDQPTAINDARRRLGNVGILRPLLFYFLFYFWRSGGDGG